MQCELTPLGFHLAHIPVEPKVGKMLIYGCIFGVLPPLLTIAAAWAGKSPFMAPMGKQSLADESKRDFAGGTHSDHLAVAAAYDSWVATRGRRDGSARSAERKFITARFLNTATLREMENTRRQFFGELQSAGFVARGARLDGPKGECDFARNVGNAALVKCVLTAALYPSVARVGPPAGRSRRPVLVTRTEAVQIHPASVNSRAEARELGGYVVFLEKVQTSAVFLRDSTAVSHYPLLLFGGTELRVDHDSGEVAIVEAGGEVWLKFRAQPKVGVLFKFLREELDRLLLAQIEAPAGGGLSGADSTAVRAVLKLLDDQ